MQASIKQQLCTHLQQLIAERKRELIQAIASAKESRDNDSKSSVGDKHETSRALAQIEIDKLEVQLDKTLHLEKDLSLLHPEKVHHQVESGSMVITNHENYFISIGLGKVELAPEIFYCISLASPIGKLLYGKKIGDRIQFNGREIEVIKVL
jgi:transcription elongation GreA/GreB family factor